MAKMGKVSNASTPTNANIVFILLSPFLPPDHSENSVKQADSPPRDLKFFHPATQE